MTDWQICKDEALANLHGHLDSGTVVDLKTWLQARLQITLADLCQQQLDDGQVIELQRQCVFLNDLLRELDPGHEVPD